MNGYVDHANMIYPGMSAPVVVEVLDTVKEDGYEGYVWVRLPEPDEADRTVVKVHQSRLTAIDENFPPES